jgi:hypothetical protein
MKNKKLIKIKLEGKQHQGMSSCGIRLGKIYNLIIEKEVK